MGKFAKTPEPPYYAVIHTSINTNVDDEYKRAGAELFMALQETPGFLGAEHARNQDGFGVTVSYWDSLETIETWRSKAVSILGEREWNQQFITRVCKVERAIDKTLS